jgi:hypothetical protein
VKNTPPAPLAASAADRAEGALAQLLKQLIPTAHLEDLAAILRKGRVARKRLVGAGHSWLL